MFSTKREDIQKYKDLSLFDNELDWYKYTKMGQYILGHSFSYGRCMIRISEGDSPECFWCKTIGPVLDRIEPLEDEFIRLHFKFSPQCLAILEECGLYDPPDPDQLYGMFHHSLFTPSRYMGKCSPSKRHNMSPANEIWFAANKLMQNFQILTGTNGVARYVVKYVNKLDDGNWCVYFYQ